MQILGPSHLSHSKCETFDRGDPCDWKSNQRGFFAPIRWGLWLGLPDLPLITTSFHPFGGGFNVSGICVGKSPNLPKCWKKWLLNLTNTLIFLTNGWRLPTNWHFVTCFTDADYLASTWQSTLGKSKELHIFLVLNSMVPLPTKTELKTNAKATWRFNPVCWWSKNIFSDAFKDEKSMLVWLSGRSGLFFDPSLKKQQQLSTPLKNSPAPHRTVTNRSAKKLGDRGNSCRRSVPTGCCVFFCAFLGVLEAVGTVSMFLGWRTLIKVQPKTPKWHKETPLDVRLGATVFQQWIPIWNARGTRLWGIRYQNFRH